MSARSSLGRAVDTPGWQRRATLAGTLVDYRDAGAVYLPYSKDYFAGPMLQAGQNRDLSGPTSIG